MFEKIFGLRLKETNVRTEIIAGITTFMIMAYIIVVNPAILEAAGIPRGPSMVATIITAAFGTLLMGIYAKRPFAIAPYMGENAFIAFTVVKILGYSWQTAPVAMFRWFGTWYPIGSVPGASDCCFIFSIHTIDEVDHNFKFQIPYFKSEAFRKREWRHINASKNCRCGKLPRIWQPSHITFQ